MGTLFSEKRSWCEMPDGGDGRDSEAGQESRIQSPGQLPVPQAPLGVGLGARPHSWCWERCQISCGDLARWGPGTWDLMATCSWLESRDRWHLCLWVLLT